MNLYKHARKYIDVKDLRRLSKEKIKKRNIAEKKKQQEIILDELKKNEMKTSPKFSNWRRELREFGEWAPIETSGPTNSTSTTFGYFIGGSPAVNHETGQQITFTYSGLDGIENYPSTITIDQGFGEVHTTNAPPFGQLGVQGYAAKLNPKYKAAQENYDKKMAEYRKDQEENLKSIKNTLKSLGTSWEELRANGWALIRDDGTSVTITPTSPNADVFNWTDNVQIQVGKQHPDADGKPYKTVGGERKNAVGSRLTDTTIHNSKVVETIKLQIGERPKPPMEQEYLMPRRTDFKDVNPQLDASQEFAQNVNADVFMNARVQSGEFTPEQQAAIDAWNAELLDTMNRHAREWEAVLKKDGVYNPEKHKGLQARHDAEMEAIWNKEPKFNTPKQPSFDSNDPNNPEYNKRFAPITVIDELSIAGLDAAWGQITNLYPDLSWTQKLAIDYARGYLKARTVSPSPMFTAAVLKAIEHNLRVKSDPGSVSSYRDMNPFDIVQTAISRLAMGRYSYKVGANGIEVTDFFDFGQSKSLGPFGIIPGLDQTAERIVDLGQRRAAEKGYKMVSTVTNRQTGKKVKVNVNPGDRVSPDGYGIPIKFTIPWSQVSPQLQNKLDPNQRTVPIVKKKKKP